MTFTADETTAASASARQFVRLAKAVRSPCGYLREAG